MLHDDGPPHLVLLSCRIRQFNWSMWFLVELVLVRDWMRDIDLFDFEGVRKGWVWEWMALPRISLDLAVVENRCCSLQHVRVLLVAVMAGEISKVELALRLHYEHSIEYEDILARLFAILRQHLCEMVLVGGFGIDFAS